MLTCNTVKEERELDARIAESVFGMDTVWEGISVQQSSGDSTPTPVPPYSTSIGASFTVAMELRRKGFIVDIHMDSSGISVRVSDNEGNIVVEHSNIISKFANYMCHAALVAVGEERRMGEDRRKARY